MEPYIYLLIFAALALANAALQWLARKLKKLEPAATGDVSAQDRAPSAAKTARTAEATRKTNSRGGQGEKRRTTNAAARAASRAASPAEKTPSVPTRQRATLAADVRAQLNDRRSVRKAFVLMAVLGPCRANEPHETGR